MAAAFLIVFTGVVGIGFALFLFSQLRKISLHKDGDKEDEKDGFLLAQASEEGHGNKASMKVRGAF
eukprot:7233500-Pyramimonas_sp.AAC.1